MTVLILFYHLQIPLQVAHSHITSTYLNESEDLLYKWRSDIEAQGCQLINTIMLRDPLNHVMSLHKVIKAKNSTREEWTKFLESPTRDGLWNTVLDFFLYNNHGLRYHDDYSNGPGGRNPYNVFIVVNANSELSPLVAAKPIQLSSICHHHRVRCPAGNMSHSELVQPRYQPWHQHHWRFFAVRQELWIPVVAIWRPDSELTTLVAPESPDLATFTVFIFVMLNLGNPTPSSNPTPTPTPNPLPLTLTRCSRWTAARWRSRSSPKLRPTRTGPPPWAALYHRMCACVRLHGASPPLASRAASP